MCRDLAPEMRRAWGRGGRSPAVPACQPHVTGALPSARESLGRSAVRPARRPRSGGEASVEETAPERSDHRGRRGIGAKHTARGTPVCLGGLAATGLQHASMLRGIGVRGSSKTLASRAPSDLSGGSGKAPTLVRATAEEGRSSLRRRRRRSDEGLPGADQTARAMTRVQTCLNDSLVLDIPAATPP